MTFPVTLRPAAAAAAAAILTAALFSGVLWRQHVVQAWPFAPDGVRSHDHGPSAEPSPPAASGHDGIHDRVAIDAHQGLLDELGVRTEAVRREPLTQTVRAVATIVPDESRISHVHTRVSGWVEELHVNTTGEVVTPGQPLLRIFSQELLSSQTEYLAARQHAASGIATAVVAGGRTRLGVLGMTPADIEAIERSGEPKRLVTVAAPRGGVVVNRGVTVGTSVDPSTTLLTIADLSRVWILAEVPEAYAAEVRAGSRAQVEIPSSGQPPFAARVDFVYPMLTERTRTLRVRLSVPNPRGTLRPGLFGTATFESAGPPVLTVPRDAVVDTGLRQHVFVATAAGFEPRPVTLGVRLADRVEIRAGLDEGERIVSSGVFLLDSESRLRATGGTGGHQHGTPPTNGRETPSPPRAPPGRDRTVPSPEVADPHRDHGSAPAAVDPHAGHDSRPPAAAPDPHAEHDSHPSTDTPDPHAGHRE
jgi:membrane fusion protein, copper/silver efflux system